MRPLTVNSILRCLPKNFELLDPKRVVRPQTYENGFAANFWQLVAKLFSQDLKTRYDPKGKDADIEALVQIWDEGSWNSFYYSIFWEYPTRTELKTDRLSSQVKKKK